MAAAETPGLLAAMLAVQGEAPTLKKSASNPAFRGSKYAPLDEIVETIGPILCKHGLVWSTLPGTDAHGHPALTYRLSHAPTGENLEGTMPLLLSKDDAQGQGSAITYARRYSLCAVLNLVADDDDDGNQAAAGAQASGGVTYGRGSAKPATDPQKKKLRFEITRNKLSAEVMDALLKGAGLVRGDKELVNDAINRLTSAQCSAVIDEIVKGAIKTGESDVPSDASGFETPPLPPEPDGEPLPFDPSVAS